MRQNWTLFVAGLFLVLTVAIFMPKTQAETDSSHPESAAPNAAAALSPAEANAPKKIEDPSISGLKTAVPPSADLESSLHKREKELAEKDLRITEAQERLKGEEARMKMKIEEFEKIQTEMAAAEENAKKTDEAILVKMVKTFETMQPKKAAGVMATLSDDAAIDLCLKLKEKKLAAIFDVMEPTRATELSTLLYKRRPTVALRGVASEGKPQGAGLAPKK